MFGAFFSIKHHGNYHLPLQACTEMVMPMCSDGVTDMFRETKWDLAKYEEGCMKTFGVKPQPDLVLKLYGGKNIAKHSKIIFRCMPNYIAVVHFYSNEDLP